MGAAATAWTTFMREEGAPIPRRREITHVRTTDPVREKRPWMALRAASIRCDTESNLGR